MICYLPDNPIVNGTTLIKCVVPLEGKACDTEREYISFFNGAASAASAASSCTYILIIIIIISI